MKSSNRLPIIGLELVEDKFILPLPGFQKVVPFVSAARYFESIKIPGSDHFTIAKPLDNLAFQHRLLVQFLNTFLENIIKNVETDKRLTAESGDTRQNSELGENSEAPFLKRSDLRLFKQIHDKFHLMYLDCDNMQNLLEAGGFVLHNNILRTQLRSLGWAHEDLKTIKNY